MSEKVTISVRIDKDVKEQFEQICKAIGLNSSYAINIKPNEFAMMQGQPFLT